MLTKVYRGLFLHITSFFLGTKKTVGEFFNPGLNCSDILDKLDDAKDGFYWITLKRSNPVKVSVFAVFNIHHFRLFLHVLKYYDLQQLMCLNVLVQGRRNWGGGQEGQLPPLPFVATSKGGKRAL